MFNLHDLTLYLLPQLYNEMKSSKPIINLTQISLVYVLTDQCGQYGAFRNDHVLNIMDSFINYNGFMY